MIEWMQRHRKYLVVTIWISTIAFVGAGFVGWGAYSFGKDGSSTLAKVGNISISLREFQMDYSNTYSYYNNLFNGALTKEKAKEIGLEQKVIQNLINRTLLLNYAKELGLKTLDSEIKEKLSSNQIFQKEGKFDIKLYNRTLRNIGLTGNEYEKNLKKEILLDKLFKILSLKPKKDVLDVLASTLFMEDKLLIKIIQTNEKEVDLDAAKLKAFWEPIKNKFKSKKSYEVLETFISLDDERVSEEEIAKHYSEKKFNYLDSSGKIKTLDDAKAEVTKDAKLAKAKKTALKKYLSIKNGKESLSKKAKVFEHDALYPTQKLSEAKESQTLKPFKRDNGYIVVQLVKTNMPQVLNFEEAKKEVIKLYTKKQIKNILTKRSKKLLSRGFKGNTTDFVSRDIKKPIKGLDLPQTQHLVNKVFESTNKKGFVLLGKKAVVYRILEQKLLDETKEKANKVQLEKMAKNLEESQMQDSLIKELAKRYKIERYYKGN